MRHKVLLSAALMHNPDLLLLDDPFSGLDVASTLVLRSLVQELAERGKIVLFSSHKLGTLERVCSRVVILHPGKIVVDDSIEALRTLMAPPHLKGNFSRFGVEQDTAAVSREIADLIQEQRAPRIEKLQFRVLCRFFLFRVVDSEFVSQQGAAARLLANSPRYC